MPEVEIETIGKSTSYRIEVDAPRNVVWNLRFGEDFAPKPLRPGYRVMSYRADYREGGEITAEMGNDEGHSYEDRGKFIRIDPHKEIVWELDSGCIHGLRIRFEEKFEEQGSRTEYRINVIFENEELLSNAAELGCERIFGEYMENFGELANRMAKSDKTLKRQERAA